MTTEEPISVFLERMVPDHTVRDYPNFVQFMKTMLEYLEENQYKDIALLDDYTDIDETLDEFLEDFRKEYGQKIPANLYSDIRFFIKNIRDFYRAKGSEKSYRFLFRTVFNRDLDFYYPGQDILRLSDGKWYSPYYLITINQDNMSDWVDHFIRGTYSGAEAYVEKTVGVTHDGKVKTALSIIDITGTFVEGEGITIIDEGVDVTDKIIDSDGGIRKGEERWLNSDGFLSWDKYFQDNYYYQDFSYVLKSELGKNAYESLVKKLLHPAGMQMFGEVVEKEIEALDVGHYAELLPFLIEWLRSHERLSEAETIYFYTFYLLEYTLDIQSRTTFDDFMDIEWTKENEEQIYNDMTLYLIEWFTQKNRTMDFVAVPLDYNYDILYIKDVMYMDRVSYKYWMRHREDPYYLKTWKISDIEWMRIDSFES